MNQKAHSQCNRKRNGYSIIQTWVQIPDLLLKKIAMVIFLLLLWRTAVRIKLSHACRSQCLARTLPFSPQLLSNPVPTHSHHTIFVTTDSRLKCRAIIMGQFIRSLSYAKDFIFIITDFYRVKCKTSSKAAACFFTSWGWERTVNNGRIIYSPEWQGMPDLLVGFHSLQGTDSLDYSICGTFGPTSYKT